MCGKQWVPGESLLQHQLKSMGKKRVAKKVGEEVAKPLASLAQESAVAEVQVRAEKTGRMYVYSSYNNTLISLTDLQGNVLVNVSAGAIGFKGTKKSTPFAASKVADVISQIAKTKGIGRVEVFMKGVGTGRDAALRAIGAKDFEILSIRDITPIPHNGPKAPKVRRV